MVALKFLIEKEVISGSHVQWINGPDNCDQSHIHLSQSSKPHGQECHVLDHEVKQWENYETEEMNELEFAFNNDVLI